MSIAYHNLSDHELLDLLKADEEAAFNEIYNRFWDKLYVIARKRLNDEFEAEEIVQDVFCNLWRRRSTLVLLKGFNNYFAVAVKFEVINRLAKRSRQAAYHMEVSHSQNEIDNSTQNRLDLNELQERLFVSVNALPEKCRIVFKLKYEQGYTQHQIASELEISEKTVEAHLAKARKSLRSALGNLFLLAVLLGYI